MSVTIDPHQAFHLGTSPFFDLLTTEQTRRLATLPPDTRLAPRVEELAEKANEGELTDEERDEYEAYIEANNVLVILQAEARFRLAAQP